MDARIDVDTLLEQSRWLRALARRLARDDAGADDLVQDTLVAALEHPPARDEGPGGLRGWLSTVLHNRARAEKRREHLRAQHEPRAARAESIDETAAHDKALDQVRLQRALAAAILDLPEPYRKAVTLRWVDGLSPRDVAVAQGITYDAARQRLARGAALLRERLDRDCGGRASWSALVLALPHDAPLPHVPLLPEILAVSSLAKVCVAVVVLVAVCLWFVLGRDTGAPVSPSTALQPPVAALEQPRTTAEAAAVTAPGPERTSLASGSEASAPAANPERLLSGIVVDPQGEPVSGARVEARHNANTGYQGLDLNAKIGEVLIAQTRTGANGRFQLDIEPGRPFVLEVEAKPYAPARLPYRYAGEEVVVHLAYGSVLAGRVLRNVDDAPVAGARLRAWPWSRSGDLRGGAVLDSHEVDVGRTDAGGRFRAEGLQPGPMRLEVLPIEESPPMWRDVDLSTGAVTNLEIRVESGPTLTGAVVDAATKQPIAGALVGENWTMKRAVRTDSGGEYALKGFPLDGVFEIGVRASGYGYKVVAVRANRQAPFPARLDVELTPARKARGRIFDARGKSIEGAYVAATASVQGESQQTDWVTTVSGATGAFELSDLRSDIPHALHVRREGFGTVTYEFPPDKPGSSDTVIDLGDVVMQDMASVRGRVHRPNGDPVPDQVVTLHGWNADRLRSGAQQQLSLDSYIGERLARTDHLGRFVFVDLAAGTYRVETRASGAHDAVRQAVEVATAARVDGVELVLDAGLAIAGRLVGPDGEPVTDCYVSIDPTGPSPATTNADVESDEQGRFRASGLAPGEYTLSTWHYVATDRREEQKKYAHREFGPVAAGSENVVVVLQPESVLRGRVLDARGEPVPAAIVVAMSTREHWESTRAVADAVGRFEIPLPADLEVVLVAGPPSESTDAEPDAARSARRSGLRAGSSIVEIRLPVAMRGG